MLHNKCGFYFIRQISSAKSLKLEGNEIGSLFNPKQLEGQDVFTTIDFEFQGSNREGTVKIFERNINDINNISCLTDGKYVCDEKSKAVEIYDAVNNNCPWFSQLNGKYALKILDKEKTLEKGTIQIILSVVEH
jgi:hypothetical protein